ncbi:HAD family phosphatase [Streptomyces sp. CRN 30]|uniref:HAD family hydrolase n=1 Tax=Streptomyces sp. CRN 30 TaxID=3075613 RepID=UPI002A841327|nr:HAD family phosphatase [Streptomyces sp. CRN 30]
MEDTAATRTDLKNLLRAVNTVLFDFDGPVCDLFAGISTARVAERIKSYTRRHWGPLDPEVSACDDSHGILRPLRNMYEQKEPKPNNRRPLRKAERIVTRREAKAARTARPTPGIFELVDNLHTLDKQLIVVSNNAEAPIRAYLERHGRYDKFEKVCGRDPADARRMKPHPDCVRRALDHLGLSRDSAPTCLLVGDQLTDLRAAKAAGTRFLGFTADVSRERAMRREGADAVVGSHARLLAAVGGLSS